MEGIVRGYVGKIAVGFQKGPVVHDRGRHDPLRSVLRLAVGLLNIPVFSEQQLLHTVSVQVRQAKAQLVRMGADG